MVSARRFLLTPGARPDFSLSSAFSFKDGRTGRLGIDCFTDDLPWALWWEMTGNDVEIVKPFARASIAIANAKTRLVATRRCLMLTKIGAKQVHCVDNV